MAKKRVLVVDSSSDRWQQIRKTLEPIVEVDMTTAAVTMVQYALGETDFDAVVFIRVNEPDMRNRLGSLLDKISVHFITDIGDLDVLSF